MSIEQVIGKFPNDPLRAWLRDEKRIVRAPDIRQENGRWVIPIYDFNHPRRRIRTLVAGEHFDLLRATGVEGKRVCPYCIDGAIPTQPDGQPEPCPHCHGTGIVPAMLYQGDVVVLPVFGLAIIKRVGCEWLANSAARGSMQLAIFDGSNITVLCTVFEAANTPKPDEVSDEQWSWLQRERAELLADIGIVRKAE